jgi:hypothetical protein
MVGSIFFKYRAQLSRTARVTILQTSLMSELLLIGLLLAYLPMNYEFIEVMLIISLIAVIACAPIGPILNMVFFNKDTANYCAGNRISKRETIYYACCIVWFVLCTGGILYLLMSFNELRVHYWVWCFVFAFGFEFLIV